MIIYYDFLKIFSNNYFLLASLNLQLKMTIAFYFHFLIQKIYREELQQPMVVENNQRNRKSNFPIKISSEII